MKNKLFISLGIALLACSCGEDYRNTDNVANDGTPVTPAESLEATPYVGAVILKWQLPENKNYYYSTISYIDEEGNQVDRKVSKYSLDSEDPTMVRAVIPNLTAGKEYEFKITAYDFAGNASEPLTVKAVPEDKSKAKDYIVKTVKFTPGVESVNITWENELNADLSLVIEHNDYYKPGAPTTVETTTFDAKTPKVETIGDLPIEEDIEMKYHMVDNETGESSETLTTSFQVEVPIEHIYDPTIPYVFTNFFNPNQMTWEFNETKNEVTITSDAKASDQYAYTTFSQQPSGTILVFRYKSETNIKNLRLYLDYPPSKMVQYKDYTKHDPNGYDGLRNTNGYWKTVRWNLTKEQKTVFNFFNPGSDGAYRMRLDPCKQKGKVHTFRNVHWEVDPNY